MTSSWLLGCGTDEYIPKKAMGGPYQMCSWKKKCHYKRPKVEWLVYDDGIYALLLKKVEKWQINHEKGIFIKPNIWFPQASFGCFVSNFEKWDHVTTGVGCFWIATTIVQISSGNVLLRKSHNAQFPIKPEWLFCNRNVHTCAYFCYKMVFWDIYFF